MGKPKFTDLVESIPDRICTLFVMVTRILLPIIAFAGLAFVFSWVINHYLPPFTWLTIDGREVLTGCGPALSGLLCYQLFGTLNTFKLSLVGSKPTVVVGVTFLSLFIPVLLNKQPNPLTAIGLVLAQFTYTLGEEFGWRHYLQNAVATFTKWQQALTIGILWFFWHYAILTDPTTMLNGQPLPFYVSVPLFERAK
jgi:hypothetical protein